MLTLAHMFFVENIQAAGIEYNDGMPSSHESIIQRLYPHTQAYGSVIYSPSSLLHLTSKKHHRSAPHLNAHSCSRFHHQTRRLPCRTKISKLNL